MTLLKKLGSGSKTVFWTPFTTSTAQCKITRTGKIRFLLSMFKNMSLQCVQKFKYAVFQRALIRRRIHLNCDILYIFIPFFFHCVCLTISYSNPSRESSSEIGDCGYVQHLIMSMTSQNEFKISYKHNFEMVVFVRKSNSTQSFHQNK